MISVSLLLLLPIMSSWSHVYHYGLLQPQAYHNRIVYNLPSFPYLQTPVQVSLKHIGYPYSHVSTQAALQPKIYTYNPKQNQFKPLSSSKKSYTFKASSLSEINTDDIVPQTQKQANNLINILKTFAKDQRVKDFVAANLSNSSCVSSIEDAISATKTVSNIVTEVSPQIIAIVKTYNQLKYEKYPPVLLRGSATLLKEIDIMVTILEDFSLSAQCSTSPENNIEGLEHLAGIVSDLATTETVSFDDEVRETLKQSAIIVHAAIDAVTSIRNIFLEFDKFCSNDEEYNTKAVDAIGELFDKVGKLLKALGSDIDITAVKEKNMRVARGLVANLEQIRDLELGFVECNTARSYEGTAEELNDVADIIDEFGIKSLEEELGIKFNLEF